MRFPYEPFVSSCRFCQLWVKGRNIRYSRVNFTLGLSNSIRYSGVRYSGVCFHIFYWNFAGLSNVVRYNGVFVVAGFVIAGSTVSCSLLQKCWLTGNAQRAVSLSIFPFLLNHIPLMQSWNTRNTAVFSPRSKTPGERYLNNYSPPKLREQRSIRKWAIRVFGIPLTQDPASRIVANHQPCTNIRLLEFGRIHGWWLT